MRNIDVPHWFEVYLYIGSLRCVYTYKDGPKVLRQPHMGEWEGKSFEVGNPCPETHRYAPESTFLERMNVRLAISLVSGQRARSGMRFSLVIFRDLCLGSSVVPRWPKKFNRMSRRGFKSFVTPAFTSIFLFTFLVKFVLSTPFRVTIKTVFGPLSITSRVKWLHTGVNFYRIWKCFKIITLVQILLIKKNRVGYFFFWPRRNKLRKSLVLKT